MPLGRDTVVSIALGVTDDGVPFFIGFSILPGESAEAYRELLADFRLRGA